MTYRRKTLTSPVRISNQQIANGRNKQRKLIPYSPSTRYQEVKKTSNQKTKLAGKKIKTNTRKFQSQKRKRYHGNAFRNNKYNPVRKRKR